MAVSDQDMLDAIDDAIFAIVSGRMASTSKPGGASLTRLSLKDLQAMKKDYEIRVSSADRGMFYVAQAQDPE